MEAVQMQTTDNTQQLAMPATDNFEMTLANESRRFDLAERYSNLMSGGVATLPKHLQGNKSDCFAVALQAVKWGMDPFSVAQKTHLVNGVLGYEAQLVNAVIISSSKIVDRAFHLDFFGDWKRVIGKFKEIPGNNGKPYKVPAWTSKDEEGLGVRIHATLRGESEPRELELLLTQAQVRNSTLWASDPKQQLAYLAQKRWARLYCPDVILGVYTPDELEESRPMRDINPAPSKAPKTSTEKSASYEQVVNDELSNAAADFLSAIESADSVEALDSLTGDISDAIANGAVDTHERSMLMDAFKTKKAALSA
jgi:hypothetical protein